VTTSITSVLLLLVGLPLLAWWVGGQRPWGRLPAVAETDPWDDFVRWHRLSAGEQVRVQEAVTRGRALDGDRLRAAAVELAEDVAARRRLSWPGSSRLQRALLLLIATWSALVLVDVVGAVVRGGLSGAPWLTLAAVAVGAGISRRQTRNLRRAVELNGTPVG
jgi:hypothetical protein